jgi:hypothetical protein
VDPARPDAGIRARVVRHSSLVRGICADAQSREDNGIPGLSRSVRLRFRSPVLHAARVREPVLAARLSRSCRRGIPSSRPSVCLQDVPPAGPCHRGAE